jgi:hypothetical protein
MDAPSKEKKMFGFMIYLFRLWNASGGIHARIARIGALAVS